LPISQKRQASMKRRLLMFSVMLFLFIFILGSASFIFLMGQILDTSAGQELKKSVELERLRLEAFINAEILIVLKMADSPLIRKIFSDANNPEMNKLILEEINAYSRALSGKSIFWVDDRDRIFHTTGHEPYLVNPDDPVNYWYNMTLNETELYNLNINFNPDLDVTNLWINAPVFNDNGKAVGMVGAGIDLTYYIDSIYKNYSGEALLYFFNNAGEITGSSDISLAKGKINLAKELNETGVEILDSVGKLVKDEIVYFNTKSEDGVAALGAIPDLNWYITAFHPFAFAEELKTGMTVLFLVMMAVILSILAVFNIFVTKLLEPLYKIVKEIGRISTDWDLDHTEKPNGKDEIETLGEFLSMTIIDPLTEIYNRRFFDGNMKSLIKLLSRTKGKLSLLMIDIDFFKNYNDTYGHDMGDNCLKEVAEELSKVITREEDFVARYGGEEFVVVLPNTDERGAFLIAEKMLNRIREIDIPHEGSKVVPYVTVSIGGTTSSVKHFQSSSDYVKCADEALYKSKQEGRNRYTFVEFKDHPE